MRQTTIRTGAARRYLRLYLPSLLEKALARVFSVRGHTYVGETPVIVEWHPRPPEPPLTEREVAQVNHWLRVQQEQRP